MENQKSKNISFIGFFLIGIVIGAFIIFMLNYLPLSTQPTIYEKLDECKATYYIAQWDPSLLNDKTDVHQFRDFDEIVQMAGVMDYLGDPILFWLDKTYNIIWRTSPTQEDWISFYFYTDPD